MADLDQSSSDVSSVDFKAKASSEDSKLGFSEDEETLISIMYNLVGKSDERCCQFLRWSLIAGRVPGRTAEEIERHWTTRQSRSK